MFSGWPIRGCLLLLWLAFHAPLNAQTALSLLGHGTTDSVRVSGYEGEPEASPASLEALWTGLDNARGTPGFSLQWPGGPGGRPFVELGELIMAGVDQYLDQRIHFTRDGVKTSLPPERITDGVERLIRATATEFGEAPPVLSGATRQQLKRVCSIDWSQARFGVDGGEDQEKYMAIYYYVRAQRMELERGIRNDLLALYGLHLHPAWDTALNDPAREVQVPTLCTSVLDDDNYLCALDLRADSGLALPDVRLTDDLLQQIAQTADAGPRAAAPKLRKRDRWLKAELDAINRRIDQSDQRKELWALRDRLDDLEGRLDDIGLQVDELGRQQEGRTTSENPVAGLSALTGRNVEVRFPVGSAELTREARILLDEVAGAMVSAPQDRVLVTGYADGTGSPTLNLALSERRAKAVRSYLLAHGIGGHRVLLNYYGSGQSSGSNASERRVELEWLR